MHYDPAPSLPKVVIVDVGECVRPFVEAVERFYHLGFETDTVLADLLDTMHKRDEALLNVSVSNEEMKQEMPSELMEDVSAYVKARKELADALFKEMSVIGLYVRNMLYYQLMELRQGTLVLQKLEVPLTDGNIRSRRVARQADLAYRRYLPRTHEECTAFGIRIDKTGFKA